MGTKLDAKRLDPSEDTGINLESGIGDEVEVHASPPMEAEHGTIESPPINEAGSYAIATRFGS